jgi:hypothetical protein
MYTNYIQYINYICTQKDLSNFKSNNNYRDILEHVSPEQGQLYLDCILSNTNLSMSDIKNFCNKNDSIGSPLKKLYGDLFVSPTSLRYIYHSHLIFEHIKSLSLNNIDIVEVGCGYGGLCLAINFFKEKYGIGVNSYKLIDLKEAINLQKIYLSMVDISNVEYIDSDTFGKDIKDSNMFLISNYCFSEISDDLQKMYIQLLFPKVSHGFMAWNHINTYNFGFAFREADEVPKTGSMNKYIYF